MSVTNIAEPVTEIEIDQLCINTIRTLSIDAVQQANSGHLEHQWRSRRWYTQFGTA